MTWPLTLWLKIYRVPGFVANNLHVKRRFSFKFTQYYKHNANFKAAVISSLATWTTVLHLTLWHSSNTSSVPPLFMNNLSPISCPQSFTNIDQRCPWPLDPRPISMGFFFSLTLNNFCVSFEKYRAEAVEKRRILVYCKPNWRNFTATWILVWNEDDLL